MNAQEKLDHLELQAMLKEEERRMKITSWLVIAFAVVIVFVKLASRSST